MVNGDSKKLQELISIFKSAEERVESVLLETNAESVEDLKIKVDKKLERVNVGLIKDSISWAKTDLPTAYKEGERKIDGSISRRLRIDETAIESSYISLAQNVQHATDHAKNVVNQAIKEAESLHGYGATVGNVKDVIQETLARENGSMIITYNNGAKMPLSAYAQMLARTSRIETANTGSFDRCKELGLDLVRCTKVPGCCPYCFKYEDKVYSISGRDTRFPSLYDTALQNGYNIMHPNCRHEFLPWHESFSGGEEELKKIIEESNHFENLDKNDKLFKLYNADQAFKRQLIKESKEFHYLKNTMGEQMPYQTLGGFRRASRSGSPQYEAVHRNVTQLEKTKRDEAILDFYSKKGYNIQESISRIEDLNRKYLSAVKDKKVEDVGFHRYAKVFVEASNELIGLKTSDGKDIKAITLHLPERIIGDGTNSYKPVKISDIKKVLTTGKVRVRAADDVQYRTETFSVSYNPIKKSVTQCNHMSAICEHLNGNNEGRLATAVLCKATFLNEKNQLQDVKFVCPASFHALGRSVVCYFSMEDNYSAGTFIDTKITQTERIDIAEYEWFMRPKGSYAVENYIPYCNGYGRTNYFGFVFLDKIDTEDSINWWSQADSYLFYKTNSDDHDLSFSKSRHSVFMGYGSDANSGGIILEKDSREKISVTCQLNFVTFNKDVEIYKAMVDTMPYLTDRKTVFKEALFKKRQYKTSEFIEGDYIDLGQISVSETGYGLATLKVAAKQTNEEGEGYGIITEEGRLCVYVHKKINNGTVPPIYFMFRNNI